jgi:hypothetical protein
MNITASKFFNAWVATVHEMRPVLVENWRNATKFTSLVKSSDDCVIKRVAVRVGLECFPSDYYSVDSVLYQKCDLVPEIPEVPTWLRALSVAFEHENDIRSGIYKEVSHLLILNADLRVLVTYPIGDGITDQELAHAHAIIHGARHEKEISDKENFLLILGSETDFAWQGFVYKHDDWKEIKPI